jgi:predicted TIM-barrel fold metal-dependent hydrolase
VREAIDGAGFDTAASSYLYEASAYSAIEPSCLLFGSDFPLIKQNRARGDIEAALPPELRQAVMGDNAARWLGLRP